MAGVRRQSHDHRHRRAPVGLYQLHHGDPVWRYTGTPFTGWVQPDGNPVTVELVAGNGNLDQRNVTEAVWDWTDR